MRSNKIGLKVPDSFITSGDWLKPEIWCNYISDRQINHNGGFTVESHIMSTWISNAYNAQKNTPGDFSLLQHYGLPTRFLDWTENRKKAAFFAAYYNLGLQNRANNIAIFAIREIKKHNNLAISNKHLRYENTFLHAQDGLFTDTSGYSEKYFLTHGEFPSLENMHEEYPDNFLLTKFILPINSIRSLLNRLEKDGIFLASMMPDYRSVAEQIKSEVETKNLYTPITQEIA